MRGRTFVENTRETSDMTKNRTSRFHGLAPAALLAMLSLVGTTAFAQEHRHGGALDHGRGVMLDHRYGHDHYYPPRGYVVPALPSGAVSIGFGGGSWFFHGGVWFRPSGPRFVVAVPPVGIVVPLLPPAYATVWIGGMAYYYANGVYYAAAPGGYAVVAPPAGAETAQPTPAAPPPKPAPDPIIYPRQGQSAQQTEADRQECNRWATTQPSAMADASVFQRAVAACMDGRGYTVR